MKLLQALMWAALGAMLCLTFVWPFAHSSDPADATFKIAALGVFALFFVALFTVIAWKACKAPRT